MKIMTMIWRIFIARHRLARQLRRKKRITAIATRTRKRITAIAMKTKKRIIAIAMKTKRRIIVTATEARSLIITMIMSIITTTDAIWQRS